MYKIIGIILYLVYVLESRKITTSNILLPDAKRNSGTPNIITRREWNASSPAGRVDNLRENPPPYVVVHHSATPGCSSVETCKRKVKSFQDYHINHQKWSDIGYNFLIGEDGNVYEGRGWGKSGAHARSYNPISIGICVIGDYSDREPNSLAIVTLKELTSYGVSINKIKSDYYLIGHRQATNTTCPGNKLFHLIKSFPHWREDPQL